eukprot:Skav202167  [mRNA]  locus=scaffold970:402697:406270:+ [translate_table: standard]
MAILFTASNSSQSESCLICIWQTCKWFSISSRHRVHISSAAPLTLSPTAERRSRASVVQAAGAAAGGRPGCSCSTWKTEWMNSRYLQLKSGSFSTSEHAKRSKRLRRARSSSDSDPGTATAVAGRAGGTLGCAGAMEAAFACAGATAASTGALSSASCAANCSNSL